MRTFCKQFWQRDTTQRWSWLRWTPIYLLLSFSGKSMRQTTFTERKYSQGTTARPHQPGSSSCPKIMVMASLAWKCSTNRTKNALVANTTCGLWTAPSSNKRVTEWQPTKMSLVSEWSEAKRSEATIGNREDWESTKKKLRSNRNINIYKSNSDTNKKTFFFPKLTPFRRILAVSLHNRSQLHSRYQAMSPRFYKPVCRFRSSNNKKRRTKKTGFIQVPNGMRKYCYS